MERRVFRGHLEHRAPLRILRRYVGKFCRLHGLPRVSVSIRRCHGGGGWYDPDGRFIFLDPNQQNALSLAHELAHHVVTYRHPHAQDHGPAWMRWYAHILDAWRLVPLAGTIDACRRHGVAMAPIGAVR